MRFRAQLTATTALLLALASPATALAAPGDAVWSDTRSGDAGDQDEAFAIDVSADGSMVVAVGMIDVVGHGQNYLTTAYDTSTGDVLWSRHYDGPVRRQDQATGIAFAGQRVIVSGVSQGRRPAKDDIVTIAYEAATGSRLWVHRYDAPEHTEEYGAAIDVAGGRAYAVGSAGPKLLVVAISLKSGRTAWTYRTKKDGQALDVLAVGRNAYVTGSTSTAGYADAWIGSFNRSGDRRWTGWVASADPLAHDFGMQLAMAGDRSRLYLAATVDTAMGLVSIDPTAGTQNWLRLSSPQPSGQDYASGVAIAPDGGSVYIAGESNDSNFDPTYLTVAFDLDGNELWTAREDDALDEGGAAAVGVSPDGSEVYVTGYGVNASPAFFGPLTVAYDSSTGEPSLWEHLTSASQVSSANVLAVASTGYVIVAGEVDLDFFVEAYET